MKKTFLVLPLAILLVNCSSTRNTSSTSANTGINNGGSMSGSMASSSGSMATSASSSTGTASNWKNNSATGTNSGGINWDVYDPNNLMQNPEKYRKPYELGKSGGWTYNKDWRRNTNFTAEAVGQWQLVLTPEVASNWMPDTRRPETYASFWTPEAVMARYQASMAAAAKTRDSLAALNPMPAGKGKYGKRGQSGLAMASNTGTSGSETTGSAAVSGSGSTGSMGTGGVSSTGSDMTANMNSTTGTSGNVTVPFAMTAVNGNNFMLPTLNMFIDNGSFTAFTGCNSAVGNIVVNGSSLHFEETTPSTNVECIGGFDQSAFIDRLRRADSYDVVNNQFRLKQGDQVLMVFAKSGQPL